MNPTTPPPAAETPTHAPGTLSVLVDAHGHLNLITDDHKVIVARANDIGMEGMANARRLAACWNACRHFSTADLESIGMGPYAEVMSGQGENDGVRLIAIERMRQVMEKGMTAEHDDAHTDQSILHAAGWIVNDLEDMATHESDADDDDPDARWPEKLALHIREKYGDDKIRRLTIAGALIAAEIDRLRRARSTPVAPTANTLQL